MIEPEDGPRLSPEERKVEKALMALYIAVPKEVADDVATVVRAGLDAAFDRGQASKPTDYSQIKSVRSLLASHGKATRELDAAIKANIELAKCNGGLATDMLDIEARCNAALTRVRELEAKWNSGVAGHVMRLEAATELLEGPDLKTQRDEAIRQRNELTRWVTTDATHHPSCLVMRTPSREHLPPIRHCSCGLNKIRKAARSYLSTDIPPENVLESMSNEQLANFKEMTTEEIDAALKEGADEAAGRIDTETTK